MATPYNDLLIVTDRYGGYHATDESAWQLEECPECSGTQMAVIARERNGRITWLRCVNCRLGLVRNDDVVDPHVKPLRNPAGVQGVELTAWEEVRECLGAGANTAAVMMCRKLLLHVAVAHGLPPKDAKDRAPSFLDAVKKLEDEGLITKRMRPWIDRIKDVGNEANHEINPIDRTVAIDVATFTEQLLRLAYEMDALMAGAAQPGGEQGPAN